jgi:hypothetical protein
METTSFELIPGEPKTYISNHPSHISIECTEGTVFEFILAPNLPLRIISRGDIRSMSITLKDEDPLHIVE